MFFVTLVEKSYFSVSSLSEYQPSNVKLSLVGFVGSFAVSFLVTFMLSTLLPPFVSKATVYIENTDTVRVALRRARDKNIQDDFWKDVLDQINKE